MMLRRFNTPGSPFIDVSVREGHCPYCEAGHHVKWGDGGIIFLEEENGDVRRLEGWRTHLEGLLVVTCRPVTPEEARKEIGAHAPS